MADGDHQNFSQMKESGYVVAPSSESHERNENENGSMPSNERPDGNDANGGFSQMGNLFFYGKFRFLNEKQLPEINTYYDQIDLSQCPKNEMLGGILLTNGFEPKIFLLKDPQFHGGMPRCDWNRLPGNMHQGGGFQGMSNQSNMDMQGPPRGPSPGAPQMGGPPNNMGQQQMHEVPAFNPAFFNQNSGPPQGGPGQVSHGNAGHPPQNMQHGGPQHISTERPHHRRSDRPRQSSRERSSSKERLPELHERYRERGGRFSDSGSTYRDERSKSRNHNASGTSGAGNSGDHYNDSFNIHASNMLSQSNINIQESQYFSPMDDAAEPESNQSENIDLQPTDDMDTGSYDYDDNSIQPAGSNEVDNGQKNRAAKQRARTNNLNDATDDLKSFMVMHHPKYLEPPNGTRTRPGVVRGALALLNDNQKKKKRKKNKKKKQKKNGTIDRRETVSVIAEMIIAIVDTRSLLRYTIS